MASPKILFVAHELGSFRNHREHVVRAAMDAGFVPTLITAPVGDTSGIDYDYRPIRIERFRLAPVLDFLLFWRVLRALLADRPAIAHFINIKPYLFGGLAARLAATLGWKGKIVMTVPGLGRLYGEAVPGNRRARLRQALVEGLLRIATRRAEVTFETSSDRDFWIDRRLIRRDQAMVTQGTGVDLHKFSPAPRKGDQPLKVLFAGRLLLSKGVDIYLKAATILRATAIQMLIAGFIERDPDAVSLEALKGCRDIRFLGEVSDMDRLLRETDIVVLPSRYREGVPRILLEAAACGCILIATRFAGSAILIEPDKTGFFLEAATGDEMAQELATRIRELSAEPARRARLGMAAAAKVRQEGFGNEEIASAFLAIYRRAVR